MKSKSFMLIAGEPSGDLLAAELVGALRERVLLDSADQTDDVQPLRTKLAPHFIGAGGPRMKAAGVDLAFDMTQHSVIGVGDPVRKSRWFLGRLMNLRRLALQKQPDAMILVDFSFFNHLFARILRWHLRRLGGPFNNWRPRIVKFVSPQVWASRPGRAYRMAQDFDLLLCIFPFEKDWYAKRVPKLRVEFVGHPMVERFHKPEIRNPKSETPAGPALVLLLPGSRKSELQRHLPVMFGALKLIQTKVSAVRARMVLPSNTLVELAKSLGIPSGVEIQVGNLPQALTQADIAIASTGTVTVECAYFGVPTVTLYKLSWGEYEFAKRIVTVKTATMPNLLAGEEIYPEFIQRDATPENIALAAVELLRDNAKRQMIKTKLEKVVASLGGAGATGRAADAIVSLLK